jgi:hypothetical protein
VEVGPDAGRPGARPAKGLDRGRLAGSPATNQSREVRRQCEFLKSVDPIIATLAVTFGKTADLLGRAYSLSD